MQTLIEDFLADVKAGKADGTYKTRRRDLRKFNEHLEAEGLEVMEVESWDVHNHLRQQGQEYADATVKSEYSSVKLLYDFLTGVRGVMEEDDHPVEDLSRADYTGNGVSKHTEDGLVYVTREEVEAMCENVLPEQALRDELIIRLMFQTGVRRGEVVDIKVDDVDRDERAISIQDSKDSTEHRSVFYQPSLDLLLNQWIDGGYRDAQSPSEYLFPTNASEKLSKTRLNTRIRKAAESAGIQEVMYEDAAGNKHYRITAHALRHGHAVEALKSGLDIKWVQEQMGHSKLETTEQYLQVLDKDVREAYRHFGTRPEA